MENAPCLAPLNTDDNLWTIKERDTDGCTYVDTLVSNKEVTKLNNGTDKTKITLG